MFILVAVLNCISTSVRDNGVKAIENLMKKRGKFDYILLETTGLADPGNTTTSMGEGGCNTTSEEEDGEGENVILRQRGRRGKGAVILRQGEKERGPVTLHRCHHIWLFLYSSVPRFHTKAK